MNIGTSTKQNALEAFTNTATETAGAAFKSVVDDKGDEKNPAVISDAVNNAVRTSSQDCRGLEQATEICEFNGIVGGKEKRFSDFTEPAGAAFKSVVDDVIECETDDELDLSAMMEEADEFGVFEGESTVNQCKEAVIECETDDELDLSAMMEEADEFGVFEGDGNGDDSKCNVDGETERKDAPNAVIQKKKQKGAKVKGGHVQDSADDGWKYVSQFTIEEEHWSKLHKDKELDASYVEYFTDYLTHVVGIACVLKSKGPYYSYGNWRFRFACTNGPCKKHFLVKQIEGCNFKLYDNGASENHNGNERCRPIRSVKRKIVKTGLVHMNPEDYEMFCQHGINKELYDRGHLQDLVSTTTTTKIRSDGLSETQDYDKDDIIDLLKMKLSEDIKFVETKGVSDVFVRRINLDPFAVVMVSNAQMKLLKKLAEDDDDITVFFDATGSVVRHARKRIYYYCGVCCVKKNKMDDKEPARLQPLFEILSGEHDAHNIRLLLEDYKQKFDDLYPSQKWPIGHTVTDFSFALLNSICRAWNGMKLLDYMNLTYKFANDADFKFKLSEAGVCTCLQLCCGHFSKTGCKDISKYFPNLDSKTQSILKEVFCSMFNIGDLNTLRSVWVLLSTILLSKYVDEDVESSLKTLAKLIVDNKSENETSESEGAEEHDVDDDVPDDACKFEAMYRQSEYFKDFSKVTFKPKFQMGTVLNVYYNVEFATVFLKKYISILCLWTCITQKNRKSNAADECHFKNTKGRLKRKAITIGALPLKAGRFCRQLQQYTMATTVANLMQYPRKNICYQQTRKRKVDDEEDGKRKRIKVDGTKSLLSLYKAMPKPRTPQTPKNAKPSTTTTTSATPRTFMHSATTPTNPPFQSSTVTTSATPQSATTSTNSPFQLTTTTPRTSMIPTSSTPRSSINGTMTKGLKLQFVEEDPAIDSASVEEQWYKRRPARHSYMDKKLIRTVAESNEIQLKKLLTKTPKTSKTGTTTKFSNGLVDNPQMYLKPLTNYVVSRTGSIFLKRDDYSLCENGTMNDELIRFLWCLFQNCIKNVQLVQCCISKILDKPDAVMFQIKKPILIGLHGTKLIIINLTQKSFASLDPGSAVDENVEDYLKNFISFLELHNIKNRASKLNIDTRGWKVEHYEHVITDSECDKMFFTFCYLRRFTCNEKIDASIQIECFRKFLLQMILLKSTLMKNRCIQCGIGNLPQKSGELSTIWVECDSCKRWTHVDCLQNIDKNILEDDTTKYFCILCEANTPKLDTPNVV